jgi:hypothetical protein
MEIMDNRRQAMHKPAEWRGPVIHNSHSHYRHPSSSFFYYDY